MAYVEAGASYTIVSLSSGKALDLKDFSSDEGAPILIYSSHGGQNQQWRFDDAGDGSYYIVSAASGKNLDLATGGFSDGIPIVQNAGSGSDSQKWEVLPTGGGFLVKNKSNSWVLDVQGGSSEDFTPILAYPENGGANQVWSLNQV